MRCQFQHCDRQQHANGLCIQHYHQQRAGRGLTPVRAQQRKRWGVRRLCVKVNMDRELVRQLDQLAYTRQLTRSGLIVELLKDVLAGNERVDALDAPLGESDQPYWHGDP